MKCARQPAAVRGRRDASPRELALEQAGAGAGAPPGRAPTWPERTSSRSVAPNPAIPGSANTAPLCPVPPNARVSGQPRYPVPANRSSLGARLARLEARRARTSARFRVRVPLCPCRIALTLRVGRAAHRAASQRHVPADAAVLARSARSALAGSSSEDGRGGEVGASLNPRSRCERVRWRSGCTEPGKGRLWVQQCARSSRCAGLRGAESARLSLARAVLSELHSCCRAHARSLQCTERRTKCHSRSWYRDRTPFGNRRGLLLPLPPLSASLRFDSPRYPALPCPFRSVSLGRASAICVECAVLVVQDPTLSLAETPRLSSAQAFSGVSRSARSRLLPSVLARQPRACRIVLPLEGLSTATMNGAGASSSLSSSSTRSLANCCCCCYCSLRRSARALPPPFGTFLTTQAL